VTGLLTGHNTLRRHLYLLRLIDSPLCRACGIKEETSAHILCECEALASLTHTYLGSFLEPEDIKSMSLGAVCSYGRATRLLCFWYGAQRARLKGLGASGPWGPVPTCNQSINAIPQWIIISSIQCPLEMPSHSLLVRCSAMLLWSTDKEMVTLGFLILPAGITAWRLVNSHSPYSCCMWF